MKTSILLWIIYLSVQCHGLKTHTFVDSHMVLQREPMKARIWGFEASPNGNVTVTLNDQKNIAFSFAKDDGSWSIDLPPQPAGSGHTLEISDGTSNVVLEDIAFGDVYLCSGQSNMEMSVQGAFNADDEIADSINYPDLRFATVKKVTSDTPEQDAPSKAANYTWRSGPEAFANASDSNYHFSYFSATCYFFGRDLYTSMGGSVPIGLLTSCWGGQKVEAFSSPDAMADKTCGGTVEEYKEVNAAQPTNNDLVYTVENPPDDTVGYDDRENFQQIGPSILWNAMIHPLLPMRFTGAVWYQGEANAGNPTSYACRFPAMIADWRVKFELPNLSFSYVELAAYPAQDYSLIRSAQGAALKLDQVGYATAIDLGDPTSTSGNIHPRRKQEVGRRLSLSVRAIQYKEQNVVHQGPLLSSVQKTWGNSFLTLNYGSDDTSKGLHLHGSAACTTCCNEFPFEVLDAKGNWTRVLNAKVQIPNKVVLETQVADVLGIRYAWEGYPQCILYNGNGGPDDHTALAAAPFEVCLHPSGSAPWTGQGCKTTTSGIDVSTLSLDANLSNE